MGKEHFNTEDQPVSVCEQAGVGSGVIDVCVLESEDF